MLWAIWAILLILQQAAFTLVSRARNSKSIMYHGVASVLSNGLWFGSQLILIDTFMDVILKADLGLFLFAGVFYITCTLIGSLSSHWLLMNFVEKKINAR